MSSVPTLQEIAAPCLSMLDDVAAWAEREGDYEAADEFRRLSRLHATRLHQSIVLLKARAVRAERIKP